MNDDTMHAYETKNLNPVHICLSQYHVVVYQMILKNLKSPQTLVSACC